VRLADNGLVAVSIVYETHSTTTDNEKGIATGWLPGELSETGKRNARELGDRRRNDGIDVIYVSDLARALETVRIAFADGHIAVRVDERLRECNYGALNGMPTEQLARQRASHVDMPWPEGESYLDVVARTRSARRHLSRPRRQTSAHRGALGQPLGAAASARRSRYA
jgi:broad specificity phosphatase PhoE